MAKQRKHPDGFEFTLDTLPHAISNREYAKHLSAEARDFVRDHYRWDTTIRRFVYAKAETQPAQVEQPAEQVADEPAVIIATPTPQPTINSAEVEVAVDGDVIIATNIRTDIRVSVPLADWESTAQVFATVERSGKQLGETELYCSEYEPTGEVFGGFKEVRIPSRVELNYHVGEDPKFCKGRDVVLVSGSGANEMDSKVEVHLIRDNAIIAQKVADFIARRIK